MKALLFFSLFCSFLSAQSQTQWARALGPTTTLDGRAITACAPDGFGGWYVVGNFTDTMSIDGSRLESNGGTDVFVARVRPDGAVVDLYGFGGHGEDRALAAVRAWAPVEVFDERLLYVVGRASQTMFSSFDSWAFTMKPTGELLTNSWEAAASALTTIACYYENKSTIAPAGFLRGEIFSSTCCSSVKTGHLGAGFTASLWTSCSFIDPTINFGAAADEEPVYHRQDAFSSVYTYASGAGPAGSFSGTLLWGGGGFKSNIPIDTLTAQGKTDMFYSHSPNGRYSDFVPKRFGCLTDTAGEEAIRAIVTDAAGNIYLTGSYVGPAVFDDLTLEGFGGTDIFVAKISPKGEVLQVTGAGGPADDDAHALQLTPDGRLVVAGTFSAQALFGGDTLTSGGGKDVFLAEMNLTTLAWRRARRLVTGPNDEAVHGLALDTLTGGAVLAGGFKDVCYAGADTLLYGGIFVTGVDLPVGGSGLTYVTPDKGSGAMTVRLFGSRMPPGTAVKLTNPGRELAAERVVRRSDYAAEVALNLKGMPTGKYDVVATLPDGRVWRLPAAFTIVTPVSVAPTAGPLTLQTPFPNPTTDVLSAPFSLTEAADVRARVTDITGRTVRVQATRRYPAGAHILEMNAAGLPPGVYVLWLEAGEARSAARFLVE